VSELRPSTVWSGGRGRTWGAYWDALFPPMLVSGWEDWKRGSTGVNVARRLWDQREHLRRAYESVHGPDPASWPTRHPGVVLDAVPTVVYAACLGCQWLGPRGQDARLASSEHEKTTDIVR